MSEEQEQLFYEMKQYLVQHSQKWNTLCDIEQLIIDKDKEIERLNQYIDFYKDLTERQNKDLERLNNIINELEKILEENKERCNINAKIFKKDFWLGLEEIYKNLLNKLQELKGDGSNEKEI